MGATTSPVAALRMLGAALSFAIMGAASSWLSGKCHWLLVALVRAGFMFALALAVARSAGVPLALTRPRSLWVRSVAGSISLVCNFYAFARLPVADVATLTNMYPLWIILLSALLTGVPPRLMEVLGMLSGLAGVVLIEQPQLGGERLAVGVALIGSVSTAVAMLGLHRLRNVDPRAIVAHFSGVAGLVAAGWIVLGRVPLLTSADTGGRVWFGLLAVAGSGTIGQFLLTKAYASGPPGPIALIGLSQVAFALILDNLVFGRSFGPETLVGFVLILAPTAWLMSASRRRLAAER